MYMDQLSRVTLAFDSIVLDPNNPRFWTQSNRPSVPEKKIADEQKQARARQEIDQHGITDLYNSMLRNGFLLLDRIVVRPIVGVADKYVVVEGNRRFRSLGKLRNDIVNGDVVEEDINEDVLDHLLSETNEIEVLLYNGSEGKDISWMFQGIRHISGIREWDPAQRAKLVAEQIDQGGKKLGVVGQQFGLSAQATGRLYRTYRALSQMRDDEEFSSKARNDYFSLFEEALRSGVLKEWMEWDESLKQFSNHSNLRRFYAWISPDEGKIVDGKPARRIHDPKHIKSVAYLIENHRIDLLDDFEEHLLSIEEARFKASSIEPKLQDWRRIMAEATSLLGELPQKALTDDAEEFIQSLNQMSSIIDQRRLMAEVVLNGK